MKKPKYLILVLIISALAFLFNSFSEKQDLSEKSKKTGSSVEINGALHITGNRLVNENDSIVVLKGMSLFGVNGWINIIILIV